MDFYLFYFYVLSVLLAFVLGLGFRELIVKFERWIRSKYQIIFKIKKVKKKEAK